APLQATRGYAAPELGGNLARARELCGQLGETTAIFPVLWFLIIFYALRAEHQTAAEIAEQISRLAEHANDPVLTAMARLIMGYSLVLRGEFIRALQHLDYVIAFYDPRQHHALAFTYACDPGVFALTWASWALWFLGYPDQGLKRGQDALALAQQQD